MEIDWKKTLKYSTYGLGALFVVLLLLLGGTLVGDKEVSTEPERQEAGAVAGKQTPNTEAKAESEGGLLIPNSVKSPGTENTSEMYTIVRVVDGDTFSVDIDGVITTIRLIGLDTPETVDPRKPVQCFGQEASEKAKTMLSGQSVRLELDASQGKLDKYGRLLAYAFLLNGTNFNENMIKEGYGHEYTYNLPYKYQTEFKKAETYARENELGLWAPGVCEEKAESIAEPPPVTVTPTGEYSCSSNIYNCGDFKTHTEAQSVYEACGGVNNDIHRLDANHDGQACESLP